ncbi:sensor histidine kinase [Microbacterium luteolum]|uniref:Oxygen sensor histidine kinase NreB n=1 Tax=Microbacterium luteolum TaxID=69367 RepID=A0ABY7XQX0_MICLT|nr:ATP-binding protein [Microbacterium luteolum]WDM44565.1 sensor histidine kinase [Microbacterium luteolum]
MSAVVRERVGWDLASAALFVVIVILAFTLPPRFPGSSWYLVATAVGIAAVYAFGARRYVSLREGPEPSPPVSWLLQAALIILLAVGTSIEPTMMLLQTIVLPLIWMTSRSTRQSILVTLLNAVVLSIAYAASDGFSPGMLLAGVVTSGLSAAFSIALGLWITRIAEWGTERQRLLAELTAAQHGLEAASRESGAAAERARLAREVHDTIAQSLTSIVMLAERSRLDGSHEAISLIEDAAREALREARALVVVESSAADPSGSLAEALRRLGERFGRETGLPVSVEASPLVVPRDLQVVLLRCAQEGLANVRKHAAAGAASLVLTVDDDAVLVVSDDGRGLGGVRPDGADIGAGGGFGLAGMRDRVALVGGTLEARDGEAAGTTLTVRIPLTVGQETA